MTDSPHELPLELEDRPAFEEPWEATAFALAVQLFSKAMGHLGGNQIIKEFVLGMNLNPITFMLLTNVILLLIGTVIDGIPGLIMAVPILLPLATEVYHIDPRHFGVVVVINLVLGLLSPPVGLCFFVAAAVTGARPGRMFMLTLPFFGVACVLLVLLSIYPFLSLSLLK